MKWKLLLFIIVAGVFWSLGRLHMGVDFTSGKCRLDDNRDAVCFLWVRR